MHFQANRVRVGANLVDLFDGVGRASSHVVGVFEADESGLRVVIDFRANDRLNLLPGEDAVFATGDTGHAAGDGRHGGEFVEIDVAALFANDLVAVMGPDFDGDEVAHTTRWDKK